MKIGGAWAESTLTVGCISGPNNGSSSRARHCQSCGPAHQWLHGSERKFGGLIGVGAEFGLTREWSAKGEVNVIWFGDDEIAASDGTRLNIGASIVQAKIGVNYRFEPALRIAGWRIGSITEAPGTCPGPFCRRSDRCRSRIRKRRRDGRDPGGPALKIFRKEGAGTGARLPLNRKTRSGGGLARRRAWPPPHPQGKSPNQQGERR